jgi:hypothetical protein
VLAKQLDFDSVETKATARSVRDEQLLPTILKASLKVFQAHPSQERIVRKYSNVGAFESVNQLLPALARDPKFNGGQDEAALMTTYDILNECVEALEEHEAEHVGADYDETKRTCSCGRGLARARLSCSPWSVPSGRPASSRQRHQACAQRRSSLSSIPARAP